MKWGSAKPRIPIKVAECGGGKWDEREHGLDYPGPLHTTNFRVTGRGHHRIEALFESGCRERGRKFSPYDENAFEQRIAMWLCCHACSFVLIDTRQRSTVIGLEREEDAEAFSREFVTTGRPPG